MRTLFCLLFIIFYSLPVYSDEIDGKLLLKKGKESLEKGDYENAIDNLTIAKEKFPLLSDYAMLWLADAYHKNGNNIESLKTIRTILKSYKDSPLIKRLRIMEIKIAEEVPDKDLQKLYKSFIKDYPDNFEMKYLYAQYLMKNGKSEEAKKIFKDVYINVNPFSKKALRNLSANDIDVEDLIERASNFMKTMDFKKAEYAYRKALKKDDGEFKDEILKGLGLALFRQKKYKRAAVIFESIKDLYWQVRSLYRTGDEEEFKEALNRLQKSGDTRAGRVMIWVANDQRRDGDTEEALKTFQTILKEYPLQSEDALWGIGWTYFLRGDYKRAADVFSKLYRTYRDTKYLYWKARSLDMIGKDAIKIYYKIMRQGRDFYGIMSYLQILSSQEQTSTVKTNEFLRSTRSIIKGSLKPSSNDRIEALIDLQLYKEALLELKYLSENARSLEDILYICLKFQELGEYKYLVRLAIRLPYIEELYHFRYPRAYNEVIEALSERYGLDPFLVLSVAREESRFDPYARSIAGALGIMQIMPRTAYRLDNKLKLGIHSSYEILNIKNNLHFGIYLLSKLIREFGSYSYALAAYNAGADKVREWLKSGNYKSVDEFIEDIPYRETLKYVKRVIVTYFEYKRIFSLQDGMIEINLEKL